MSTLTAQLIDKSSPRLTIKNLEITFLSLLALKKPNKPIIPLISARLWCYNPRRFKNHLYLTHTKRHQIKL